MRLEAAFEKYFHRADPGPRRDVYTLIVTHRNLIRYFVLRYVPSYLPPLLNDCLFMYWVLFPGLFSFHLRLGRDLRSATPPSPG